MFETMATITRLFEDHIYKTITIMLNTVSMARGSDIAFYLSIIGYSHPYQGTLRLLLSIIPDYSFCSGYINRVTS